MALPPLPTRKPDPPPSGYDLSVMALGLGDTSWRFDGANQGATLHSTGWVYQGYGPGVAGPSTASALDTSPLMLLAVSALGLALLLWGARDA